MWAVRVNCGSNLIPRNTGFWIAGNSWPRGVRLGLSLPAGSLGSGLNRVADHLEILVDTFQRWIHSFTAFRQGWSWASHSSTERAQASRGTSSAKRDLVNSVGRSSSMSFTYISHRSGDRMLSWGGFLGILSCLIGPLPIGRVPAGLSEKP